MGSTKAGSDNVSNENTGKLNTDPNQEQSAIESRVAYTPVPYSGEDDGDRKRPVWRIRFDVLSSDPVVSFGLDVNGDVVLGRGEDDPGLVDLTPYGAEALGVSRRHLMLRPQAAVLFVLDLDSTNGTKQNNRSIGVNTPYSLHSGDILTLGGFQLAVTVVDTPKGVPARLDEQLNLAEVLTQLAKAITSQRKLDEVLGQALEMAMSLTQAGETAIWLVDEQTGELFLEAERGIDDELIKRMRLPVAENTLAGKVITTGKPLRVSQETTGKKIKIKTGYMVEAVLYVPMALGDVTFGVLAAAHREPGQEFTVHDEELLTVIADLAAIAVQNSRQFEAADKALARRVAELAAVNELSKVVSASLDLDKVYGALKEQLRKQWQVEAAGLWLVDETTNDVVPFAESPDQMDSRVHRTFKMGQGIIGKVAQSGEPLLSKEIQTSSDTDDAAIETTVKLVALSTACVPLRIEGQVIGALAMFGKDRFSAEDLDRLQTFGNTVATAIQNARLFAQSERERATIRQTAIMLSQPLIIINDLGKVVLSNQAADDLLESIRQLGGSRTQEHETRPLPLELLDSLRKSIGHSKETTIGAQSYVATVEHSPQVGTIIVMLDVTNQRKLERLRTEFAQAVSHDLRGPLGSITGYARLLKDHRISHSERDEILDDILGASSRAKSIADQLHDFALLGEAPTTDYSSCDLMGVVTNAVGDLRGAASSKSIKLDFEVTGTPYEIRGDATRLYRSTLNLLENAIKHSPGDSRVSVKLIFEQEGVTLKVRGSGPGIPDEELGRIFDKYYRVKDTAEREPGIGLGLVMVKATVEAHEGKVHAHNVKGHGTEFVVRLPSRTRNTS